jgi:hypothetical protein
MKTFLFTLGWVFSFQLIFSQNAFKPSVSIAPVNCSMCQEPSVLNDVVQSNLNNQMSANGIKGNIGDSPFYLLPKVVVLDQKRMNGVATSTSIEAKFSLYLVDMIDGTVLQTLSLTIRGAGSDLDAAVVNGVKRLDRNADFKSFFTNFEKAMERSYSSHCPDIFEAYTKYKMKDYSAALAILNRTLPGKCDVLKLYLISEISSTVNYKNCAVAYKEAIAAYTSNNFEKAAKLLMGVDESCGDYYPKTEALIKDIQAAKLLKDKMEQSKLDLKKAEIDNKLEYEKYVVRLDKEKEYLKSKQQLEIDKISSTHNIWGLGSQILDKFTIGN